MRKKNSYAQLDIDELIDYTNVKIVRSRRFRVTDRSKLQLILKEQKVQTRLLATAGFCQQVSGVWLPGTLLQ